MLKFDHQLYNKISELNTIVKTHKHYSDNTDGLRLIAEIQRMKANFSEIANVLTELPHTTIDLKSFMIVTQCLVMDVEKSVEIIESLFSIEDLIAQSYVFISDYAFPHEIFSTYFIRSRLETLTHENIANSSNPNLISHSLSLIDDLLPSLIPHELLLSVNFLCKHDKVEFINFTSNLPDIYKTYIITSCIQQQKITEMFISMNSRHLSRICFFNIVNKLTHANQGWTNDEDMIVKLLINIYNKGDFEYFMAYLNEYPCRFDTFQRPLGIALSKINSRDALEYYAHAISLYPHDVNTPHVNSREQVEKCMINFEKHATTILKKQCWEILFRRWESWNFNENTKESYLFSIAISDIDYPVIKHFMHNLNKNKRQKYIDNQINKLTNITNIWHDSQSSFLSYYYRCMSLLQIPYHANMAASLKNKKIDLKKHFSHSEKKYAKLFFRL